jgi:aryl-alcohol dehydrogenase-like predicted oxidoreductase
VLVGARNRLELEANARAANGTIPDGLFDKLNQATDPLLKKMGIRFDYYESARNDRT